MDWREWLEKNSERDGGRWGTKQQIENQKKRDEREIKRLKEQSMKEEESLDKLTDNKLEEVEKLKSWEIWLNKRQGEFIGMDPNFKPIKLPRNDDEVDPLEGRALPTERFEMPKQGGKPTKMMTEPVQGIPASRDFPNIPPKKDPTSSGSPFTRPTKDTRDALGDREDYKSSKPNYKKQGGVKGKLQSVRDRFKRYPKYNSPENIGEGVKTIPPTNWRDSHPEYKAPKIKSLWLQWLESQSNVDWVDKTGTGMGSDFGNPHETGKEEDWMRPQDGFNAHIKPDNKHYKGLDNKETGDNDNRS